MEIPITSDQLVGTIEHNDNNVVNCIPMESRDTIQWVAGAESVKQ